jgi:hypothetical protein
MLSRLLHFGVLASALVLTVAGARAQGSLLVVDAAGGPGSVATQIAGAIDLAQDGDTLLVRAGSYVPFTIEARTLIIVAEPGAEVVIVNPDGVPDAVTTVRGIASNQAVVLEGLEVRGDFTDGDVPADALRIEQCAGQVWIQDCVLETQDFWSTFAGLQVIDSSNVLVVRTTCSGTTPGFFGSPAGLLAEGSRVFAYESSFTGGTGAPGAQLTDTFLFAEQTAIQGGSPVTHIDMFGQCFPISPGGVGLWLAGTARAELLESTYAGGSSGVWCEVGGGDYFGLASALHEIPGPALSFAVSSPSVDGQPASLELEGPPGDVGLALMALSLPPVAWVGKFKGAIATGTPILFVLGPIPGSGELVLPLDFGDALQPGTGSTIFLQGGVLHAGGGAQLGDPATLTTFEE